MAFRQRPASTRDFTRSPTWSKDDVLRVTLESLENFFIELVPSEREDVNYWRIARGVQPPTLLPEKPTRRYDIYVDDVETGRRPWFLVEARRGSGEYGRFTAAYPVMTIIPCTLSEAYIVPLEVTEKPMPSQSRYYRLR